MPVAAARQTEVLPRHADPLEVPRGGKHPLDELAVLVLDPLSLHQSASSLGDTVGESIADRLQLAEIEHPRCRGGGLDAVRDLRVTEPLSDKAGELRLETTDLPAQLQPRLALVDRDVQPIEVPLSQQSRHLQRV